MKPVEQLQKAYQAWIKRASKWTHVFEDDLAVLLRECANHDLEAVVDDGYVYISGQIDNKGEWDCFETAVEVIYE
jgi:hypothetical protein